MSTACLCPERSVIVTDEVVIEGGPAKVRPLGARKLVVTCGADVTIRKPSDEQPIRESEPEPFWEGG